MEVLVDAGCNTAAKSIKTGETGVDVAQRKGHDAVVLRLRRLLFERKAERKTIALKKEAKRLIAQGGLRVNLEPCDAADHELSASDILHNKLIWLKKGKKKNHIIFID